MSAFTLVSGLL